MSNEGIFPSSPSKEELLSAPAEARKRFDLKMRQERQRRLRCREAGGARIGRGGAASGKDVTRYLTIRSLHSTQIWIEDP